MFIDVYAARSAGAIRIKHGAYLTDKRSDICHMVTFSWRFLQLGVLIWLTENETREMGRQVLLRECFLFLILITS